MSILDRFLGTQRPIAAAAEPGPDDQAIARYRYLLRTAPPETIEQAHAEAFAALTPEQRRAVLEQLGDAVPAAERAAATRGGDDPQALARVATRAEMRQPGTMERIFGGFGRPAGFGAPGGGMGGFGGLMAGGFLSSMAGTVLGSVIAQHFFTSHPDASHLFGGDANVADGTPQASDPFHTSDGLAGDSGAADTGFAGGDADPGAVDGGVDSGGVDSGGVDSGGFDSGGFDSGGFDV